MSGIKIKEANMMKLLGKRASILTTTLRNRTDKYKTELIKDMQRDTTGAFERGDLKPIIASTFNLSEASDALLFMKNNLNFGKIILSNDL